MFLYLWWLLRTRKYFNMCHITLVFTLVPLSRVYRVNCLIDFWHIFKIHLSYVRVCKSFDHQPSSSLACVTRLSFMLWKNLLCDFFLFSINALVRCERTKSFWKWMRIWKCEAAICMKKGKQIISRLQSSMNSGEKSH